MRKSEDKATKVSKADAALFDSIAPLVHAMKEEYSELSKKKPDATLNKLKVQGVNRLLADLRTVLKDEPTLKYLDILSDDDLPQYSDVTLILSQYVAAMEAFKASRQFHNQATYANEWRIG
jgi:hypothetical protein